MTSPMLAAHNAFHNCRTKLRDQVCNNSVDVQVEFMGNVPSSLQGFQNMIEWGHMVNFFYSV